jgi:hypothetical protein
VFCWVLQTAETIVQYRAWISQIWLKGWKKCLGQKCCSINQPSLLTVPVSKKTMFRGEHNGPSHFIHLYWTISCPCYVGLPFNIRFHVQFLGYLFVNNFNPSFLLVLGSAFLFFTLRICDLFKRIELFFRILTKVSCLSQTALVGKSKESSVSDISIRS